MSHVVSIVGNEATSLAQSSVNATDWATYQLPAVAVGGTVPAAADVLLDYFRGQGDFSKESVLWAVARMFVSQDQNPANLRIEPPTELAAAIIAAAQGGAGAGAQGQKLSHVL